MTRKVYADLTVKIIVEFDDGHEDAAIMSTEFISDYNFEASEGASIVSTEITDIDVEFDDGYEDAAIMSTEFISDYNFEASEGASIVSTEITDIEITDAK